MKLVGSFLQTRTLSKTIGRLFSFIFYFGEIGLRTTMCTDLVTFRLIHNVMIIESHIDINIDVHIITNIEIDIKFDIEIGIAYCLLPIYGPGVYCLYANM